MNYPSDINNKQFLLIEKYFVRKEKRGQKREIPIVLILNAIFYILKTGCQWRMLPNDFPQWKKVYHYFRLWSKQGIIERIHNEMRKLARKKEGKESELSLGILMLATEASGLKALLKCFNCKVEIVGKLVGQLVPNYKRAYFLKVLKLILLDFVYLSLIRRLNQY